MPKRPEGVAVAAISDLIENAVKHRSEPHKSIDVNMPWLHRFIAPIQIDEKLYGAHLRIRETLDGKKFYDHSLLHGIERPARTLCGLQAKYSRHRSKVGLSEISIEVPFPE